MEEYRFWGAAEAEKVAVNTGYPGIVRPADMYDILQRCWCAETCAPRMRKDWSEEDRTLGQCSVTSFLAQDLFGGEVIGIPLDDGSFHCFNVVDGHAFDLTSEQFKGIALEYAARHLGIRTDEIVAFGDSLNDLPMMQAAGRSVIVANGREDVKPLCDEVCLSNEEDGVARYLSEHFLSGEVMK